MVETRLQGQERIVNCQLFECVLVVDLCGINDHLSHRTKFWWDKTLNNQSSQSFGKETFGGKSEIWLGKTLGNNIATFH